MTTTASIPTPAPATSSPRAHLRSEHQAIVVVERRMARQGDAKAPDTPPGWNWILGNARISDLYDRMFAETHLTWSSMIVPEEQTATFAALAVPAASRQAIAAFNGQLQLSPESLTIKPDDGEPLYLLFNGQCFPICDLYEAIATHRANRCDVTMIDCPEPRRKAYDESLRIDSQGQVQRVDRSYGGADRVAAAHEWPAIVIVSADAMRKLLTNELPQRIRDWPAAMLRAGLRLCGSTIPGRVFSLRDRQHLYELNEMLLRLRPQWIAQAGNLVDQGQKIWVGRQVRIASSAQVIGPVAIGDDVEIGPDAVIVGPTTIGRGSRIGANIILKRSVVMPNTTLASAAQKAVSLSQAIVVGGDAPTIQAITPESDGDLQALSIDRPIRIETVLEASGGPRLSGISYRWFCVAKRGVDILGSLAFMLLTLPFYPLIALAIKINSPGPVFYGHVRQGRGGRNFRCWKFRTMVPNADEIKRQLATKNEVDGPQFKMKDDPRIFAVGRFLRRFNIDEWPQAFNVLFGDMSLVGPRPSPDRENQMCPAWREARLSVRPGITGLWQVMRRRGGETDFQEWIYYDVQYVKKQSVLMDIKIMLRTILIVLRGRGH